MKIEYQFQKKSVAIPYLNLIFSPFLGFFK